MNILFTVASYYPNKDGVQQVTQYQAEGLVKLGHTVIVITSDNHGKYNRYEMHNGVRIIRVNAYNKKTIHFGDKTCYQDIVLKYAHKADVMINVCLQSFAADWVLPIINLISCRKYLILHGMHVFGYSIYDKSTFKNIAAQTIRNIRWGVFYKSNWDKIKKYDKVIHIDKWDGSLDYFVNHGYHNNEVIYNAVCEEFFDNIASKESIIINVGTFVSRKNQVLALESFYKAETQNYKLVLIGRPNNDYYHDLLKRKKEYDAQYGKKDVEIICDLDRISTIEYIRKSSIYFQSSRSEFFPISVLEAMASGSGWVSTDVGIMKHLPGGIVCTNYSDLPNAIEKMITDWQKYGHQGQKFAMDHCRQSDVIKQIETVIMD